MQGCLWILGFMVLLGLGEYALLRFTPFAGSVGLPIIAALLAGLFAGNLWGLSVAWRKRAAVAQPPARWRDGDLVGFSGTLEVERAPLPAPASGRPCALYEYKLARTEVRRSSKGSQSREVSAFGGVGMTACYVRGTTQRYRLVGFPLLTEGKNNLADRASLERVAAHLLSSAIRPKAGLRATWQEWKEILADADGVVRHDSQNAEHFDLEPFRRADDPDDLRSPEQRLADKLQDEGWYVEEMLFAEREQVAAFGRYRAPLQAIDVGSGLVHVEHGLFRGRAEQVAGKALRNSAIAVLIFGALAISVHAWLGRALLPGWLAGWRSDAQLGTGDVFAASFHSSDATDRVAEAASRGDLWALDALLRLGAPPEYPASDQTQPLEQAQDGASVERLLAHGADPEFVAPDRPTPLMRFAAQTGKLDAVRALLAGGAEVDAVDPYQWSALMHAARAGEVETVAALLDAGADPNRTDAEGAAALDHARAEGHAKVVGLLLERGARGSRVIAEDGTAVALGDPIIQLVDAYLAALHARDGARMIELHPTMEASMLKIVDWDAYTGARPTRVTTVRGWAGSDAATIEVQGPDESGSPSLTIGFQLSRSAAGDGPPAAYDGWHIRREWIEWGKLRDGGRGE